MSELTTDKALRFIADGLCDCMGTLEEHHTNGCPQDEVAVAWLAQVRREAAVKALREAADDMDARANKNELIARADRYEGFYAGVRASLQNEESYLRVRAERMEAAFEVFLPHIEKEIRAQVAADIWDYWDACGDLIDDRDSARQAIDAIAARIAEGVER